MLYPLTIERSILMTGFVKKEKKEAKTGEKYWHEMSTSETHSMWSENIKKLLKKMGLC